MTFVNSSAFSVVQEGELISIGIFPLFSADDDGNLFELSDLDSLVQILIFIQTFVDKQEEDAGVIPFVPFGGSLLWVFLNESIGVAVPLVGSSGVSLADHSLNGSFFV